MKSIQPLYDSLQDPYIRRILCLLTWERDLCVCELVHIMVLPQPRISRHLGLLREAGLVSTQRAGTWVFYRLSESLPPWVVHMLDLVVLGETNTAESIADLKRLRERPIRHAERLAEAGTGQVKV